MTTTDAAFLAEVEKFLTSSDLPTINVGGDERWLDHKAKCIVDYATKRELDRMKDRQRRREYRARRQVERDNLKQEVEKLTDELNQAKGLYNSAWKMLAQRQLAARLSSEAEQRQLYEAINAQGKLMEEIYRLIFENEAEVCCQPRHVRLEPSDLEIFAAYIHDLDEVYAQTDGTLLSWGLSAEENWNSPSNTWDDGMGYLKFRDKITIPFDFRELCKYQWQAAHLLHRQESREPFDDVEDPANTLALKFRVTTHLGSGQVGTALQRIVIRRYDEDERMVLVWRLFRGCSLACIRTRLDGASQRRHKTQRERGLSSERACATCPCTLAACPHKIRSSISSIANELSLP